MQVRSRMATWMLLVVSAGAITSSVSAGGPPPVKQQVILNLRIDGITRGEGAELVIKPGHAATRFKTINYPVKGDGIIQDIPPINIETVSADRNCSFAIVLKEAGQPEKTFRRNLQIQTPTEATTGKPQVFNCYLSSRTIAAKVGAAPTAVPVATKPATSAGVIKR